MKTLIAKIEGEAVLVNPGTPTDIQLNKKPAWRNWDKLRQLGWVSKRLVGDADAGGALIWHYPENDEDKLELEIATYDWYYQMSDDFGVYSAGVQKDARIADLATKVGQDKYMSIWNTYVIKASTNYADPTEFLERYLKLQ